MRRSALVLLLALLFFAPGCGGDSDGPTSPPPDPVAGATLAVDQVGTFDPVLVEGLASPGGAARAESYVASLRADGAADIAIPLEHDGESWFFIAPLHPVSFDAPGLFEVRIRSGSQESPPQELTVEPLPAAPGAFSAMVAKLREHLELVASQSGTSLAALKSTSAAEVAPELLPLKLAQAYLDSDVDPHDLTDLAANADGFLDAAEVGMLDRAFGYVDLERYLQLQIDELEALEPAPPLPMARAEAGRRRCFDVRPDITTAPELARAMTRSRVAEIGADPNSEAGRILDAGGTYLTGVGFISGAGGVAAIAGVSLSAVSAAMGAYSGIYPTVFTKLEAEVSPTAFNEDSTDHATWENVWVTANSTGWSADGFIATTIINLVGGYLSEFELARIRDSDLLRDLAALGLGTGAGAVFDETGIIEFCANDWRIDISSPLYCTAAAIDRRFEVDVEAQTATPSAPGEDVLRVAAQAAQFGGRSIHLDFPVEVRAIEVVVTPAEVVVREPGEDVQIAAEIHNADLTTLRWLPEKGSWNDDIIGTDTNGGRTRTLATPTSTQDYPFFVRVESLSRNGIRASGEPPIYGYARVVLEAPQVVITPGYACISPGETQQFRATIQGVENPSQYRIVWDVVYGYGSIDQNGLYRSLEGGTSNNEIAAWLEEFPAVGDTVAVDASACNCALKIEITGDAVWSRESSQVAYTVATFDDLFYQFFFDIGGDNIPGISASIGSYPDEPSPRPGDTGSWKAGFGFFSGAETWSSIWDPDLPLPGVTLNITEFTETEMIGSFTGNAFQLDENGDISSIIGVDVQFRAGYWDGGRWPCE